MHNETPIALQAYESLAERYSALAETKPENGYIEHPAMRAQIGKVEGLKIFDAGCGPGILSHHLLKSGAAEVTGADISPKMIELARCREPRANFFNADLAVPLTELKDQEFDMVVSSLAIDYVRDWTTPLNEFRRILKRGGRLIFSVQHPIGAYLWYKPPTGFGVHYVEATWRGFGGDPVVVPDYYRSFAEMINPVIKAGFTIKEISDAKPIEELKEIDRDHYERFSKQPIFMIIEATRI